MGGVKEEDPIGCLDEGVKWRVLPSFIKFGFDKALGALSDPSRVFPMMTYVRHNNATIAVPQKDQRSSYFLFSVSTLSGPCFPWMVCTNLLRLANTFHFTQESTAVVKDGVKGMSLQISVVAIGHRSATWKGF
jgi:hypothetical protein